MKRLIGFLISFVLLISVFTVSASAAASAVYTADKQFTERDLLQTPDLSGAVSYTMSDGQNKLSQQAHMYSPAQQTMPR